MIFDISETKILCIEEAGKLKIFQKKIDEMEFKKQKTRKIKMHNETVLVSSSVKKDGVDCLLIGLTDGSIHVFTMNSIFDFSGKQTNDLLKTFIEEPRT